MIYFDKKSFQFQKHNTRSTARGYFFKNLNIVWREKKLKKLNKNIK